MRVGWRLFFVRRSTDEARLRQKRRRGVSTQKNDDVDSLKRSRCACSQHVCDGLTIAHVDRTKYILLHEVQRVTYVPAGAGENGAFLPWPRPPSFEIRRPSKNNSRRLGTRRTSLLASELSNAAHPFVLPVPPIAVSTPAALSPFPCINVVAPVALSLTLGL